HAVAVEEAVAQQDAVVAGGGLAELAQRGRQALAVDGLEQQAACDVYLSLHRSEGFGLGLAECMALGRPVIATAYSGNLQFMDADNSCLVPYRLVPVNEGEYPDWRDQHWAEPDVAAAAVQLRRLADDPAAVQRLGAAARASLQQRLSPQAGAEAIRRRLDHARGQRLR
ncbi:MAG TPA: glycosyltransferase, partial [Tahibacter sp.]|nr:glycosyltransferase [Tahibacter sp.]